jgi:hypothetical protein
MQPSQLLSLAVYVGSAVIFTAAVVMRSRWAHWVRGLVLALLYIAIAFIAACELPIAQLPFWSRDFSLTWTMLVVACATALAFLSPRTAVPHREVWLRNHASCPASGIGPEPHPTATSECSGAHGEESPASLRDGAGNRRPRQCLIRVLLTAAVGVGLMALYWHGAQQNLVHVNTDPGQRDQNAYIGYAEDLLNEDFSHIAGRNRMPLFPFLLSFGLDPADPREIAFARAKQFSVGLSIVLLALLGALLVRSLSPLEAGTLWLISAFSVYIFRAAYVQPELLYYTLTAFLFVLMLRYLRRPGLEMAASIGILAGLVHLTKASILPGLAVFLLVALGWGAALALREGRTVGRPRALARLAGLLALVVGFFLLTVFPYIKNSWYMTGRPFYNVNSTFYLWYDSWREAELGTKAHGDRNGWPDMPANEIPSFQRYIGEHSARQILGRFVQGASLTVQEATGSYGYAKYILLFGLALAAALCLQPRSLGGIFQRHKQHIAFAGVYILVYALFYSWYAQIAGGNRLVLGLFLPVLLTLAFGLRLTLGSRMIQWHGAGIGLVDLTHGLILLVVMLDIYFVTTQRVLTTFGGS